jgi:hypothetical protein
MAEYSFVTVWRHQAPIEAVYDAIADSIRWAGVATEPELGAQPSAVITRASIAIAAKSSVRYEIE